MKYNADVITKKNLGISEKHLDPTLIIHAGSFHADDVLCAALMKTVYPNASVKRVFNVTDEMENDEKTLICDVGKKYNPEKREYDHHNDCPDVSPDIHIKSSAIGLMLTDPVLLEEMHSQGLQLPSTQKFQNALIAIQAIDNGISLEESPYKSKISEQVSQMVASSNPVWDSEQPFDEAFAETVAFVQEQIVEPLLKNQELSKENLEAIAIRAESKDKEYKDSQQRAEVIVNKSLEEARENGSADTVVLPQYCPWDTTLVPSEAAFVIYPSNRGGYNLQCVPPELDSFDKKVELPDWSENKPEGMTFEHPAKFLASFETLDQAQAAANMVIRQHEYDRASDYSIPFKQLSDKERTLRYEIDAERVTGQKGWGRAADWQIKFNQLSPKEQARRTVLADAYARNELNNNESFLEKMEKESVSRVAEQKDDVGKTEH